MTPTTTAATSLRPGLSRASALASLILAASSSHDGVSGQIIFIPTTTRSYFPDPSTSVSSSSYYQDEPPCRTRRLEPFRQRIREECRVDARVHCHQGGGTADDLVRSLMLPVSSPTGHDERRMTTTTLAVAILLLLPAVSVVAQTAADPDAANHKFHFFCGSSFFDIQTDTCADRQWCPSGECLISGHTCFANTPCDARLIENITLESLLDAIFAPSQSAGKYADPLDRIFEEMMNFSLLAFDEASSSSSSSSLASAVAWSSEGGGGAAPSEADDVVAAAPVPIAPEIAAENALDVAVATLAKRSIHRSDSEDGAAAADAVVSSPTFPDVDELHDRLFRLGSGLLTEARGDKRRLLEVGGDDEAADNVVDPHARVRVRLARRLTEYRTDLFYHPDGAVTVYTRSYPPSSRAPSRPPLGTGSDHVDECLMSRMSNGDLDGGCLEAVREFSRATTDWTLQDAVEEFSRATGRVVVVAGGTDSDAKERAIDLVQSYETLLFRTCQVFFSNLMLLSIAFILVALVVDRINASYDEDDEEDAGEFDYEMLPDGNRDDDDGVDRDGCDGGEESRPPRVYVGVPLQVV